MSFVDIVRTAFYSLGANRLRASLSLLGIVLGVCAVTVIVSIGRGFSSELNEIFDSLGSNLVFVYSTRGDDGEPLTLTDAETIGDELYAPSVNAVAPQIDSFGVFVHENNESRTSITGVTPVFLDVRNLDMASGIFIAPQHLEDRAEVVVLGASLSEELFGNRDPAGQYVRVNGRRFRIIGVLDSVGNAGFGSFDNDAFTPITTAYYRLAFQRTASGEITVDQITVQAKDSTLVDKAVDEVEGVLRLSHRIKEEDDFRIFNQQEVLESANQAVSAFTIFLGAVAGISLLVGGIGIMNIMLVSVTERTREIGIRQAMGAKRRDILAQFVAESIVLTLSGGVMGVSIGVLISLLLNGVQLGEGFTLNTTISRDIVIWALSISIGIGMFFGIYPAVRASRMRPIEALRYE